MMTSVIRCVGRINYFFSTVNLIPDVESDERIFSVRMKSHSPPPPSPERERQFLLNGGRAAELATLILFRDFSFPSARFPISLGNCR